MRTHLHSPGLLLCAALLAGAGCADRGDETAAKKRAEQAYRARPQGRETPYYNVQNLITLAVGKHSIDVWTDGGLFVERGRLDLSLAFADPSVLDKEELTAEITCASIGAGRQSV